VKIATLLIPFVLLASAGCKKNIDTKDAVHAAMMDYLSKRGSIQVSQMDVSIEDVKFRDNEADATVGFKPKGTTGAPGMQMKYTLEKKSGQWVVKGRAESAGAHSGGMGTGMGMGKPDAESPQMPAGHPPAGAAKEAPAAKK
jgi:hypothetical protein